MAGPFSPGIQGRRELILARLRAASVPLSIAAIADELGVHPNTVRFHLAALVAAGRVVRVRDDIRGPGRPPIVYRASRSMDRSGPSNYRLLATILTSHFAVSTRNSVATATELGRTWGASLVRAREDGRAASKTESLHRIVTVLAELGFEPESRVGSRTKQIRLRHCPFLDLVDEHADVICSLHLGLMRGALEASNAPVTVGRLDSFVEPDLCVAHLTSSKALHNSPL